MNRNIIRDPKRRKRWAAQQGLLCWACRRPAAYGHNLEVAHILGGACRTDEECNLAWLGRSCHGSNHGQRIIVNGQPPAVVKLTLANMIFLKLVHDPENYDWRRLQQIKGETIPLGKAPDEWYGSLAFPDRDRMEVEK